MGVQKSKNVKTVRLSPAERKSIDQYFAFEPVWDTGALLSKLREYEDTLPPNKDPYYRKFQLGHAEFILKNAGFQPIVDHLTSSIDYDTRVEKYQMWAHASGVLVTLRTYELDKNLFSPELARVSHVTVLGHINCGLGRYSSHLTHPMSGSTSHSALRSGESVCHKSMYSIDNPHALVEALDSLQQAGRLVPFSEQSTDETHIYNNISMYLSLSDYGLTVTDLERQDNRRHSTKAQLNANAPKLAKIFWKNVLDVAHNADQRFPGLGAVIVASESRFSTKKSGDTKGPADLFDEIAKHANQVGVGRIIHNPHGPFVGEGKNLRDWRPVEEAIEFVHRQADYNLQRYLNPTDRLRMTRWLDVLEGAEHAPIDWSTVDTSSITHHGVAFVHLCAALDANNYSRRARRLPPLLLQAIEHTPADVLTRLCQTPLPDGNTLPLTLVNLVVHTEAYRRREELVLHQQLPQVLDALAAKVPASQWSDSGNTVSGIWAKGFHCLVINGFSGGLMQLEETNALASSAFQARGMALEEQCRVKYPLSITTAPSRGSSVFVPPFEVNVPSLEEGWSEIVAHVPFEKQEKADQALKILLTEVVRPATQEPPKRQRRM